MDAQTQQPWWRGSRGEWYVVAQLVLIALVFFGPRNAAALPEWPVSLSRIAMTAGALLILVGGALFVFAIFRLGKSITPLPRPKEEAQLVQTGPYRAVRHPIYAGGLLVAFGWALLVNGTLTLVWAIVLFVFFDIKSRREERWLVEKYPDYPDYQRRVRKLIPFLY